MDGRHLRSEEEVDRHAYGKGRPRSYILHIASYSAYLSAFLRISNTFDVYYCEDAAPSEAGRDDT